ncbi:MAG: PIN domain-containing protein [Akkermansiaceae bacterium]|nr:PIN domain-containing protein [Akkermansiaceae bacterium]
MPAKTFLDTNILIYSIDRAYPSKQETAISLIATHAKQRSGIISTQVLQEFYSAATRKLGVPPTLAKQYLTDFRIFDIVQVTPDIIESGIASSILHQLSFWDGLILAAASTANTDILLTENLNHDQTIQGIKIQNPFL